MTEQQFKADMYRCAQELAGQTAILLSDKGREALGPLFEFIRSFDDEAFHDDILGAFIGIVKHVRETVDSEDGDGLDLGEP
jgi:hypothetical protein